MTTFPCPSCGHPNDLDSANCSSCGIAFYLDGVDSSLTSRLPREEGTQNRRWRRVRKGGESRTTFPCPDCGYPNNFDSENCSDCGVAFYVDGANKPPRSGVRELLSFPCPRCRQPNEIGSGNCASCGARLHTDMENKRKQEEWRRASRAKKLGWYLWALVRALGQADQGPG
jgi:hypothetical protein